MAKNQGHRERLLAAANKLVLRKGLSATRVDEICAEAEVTKGSFYHHFESKEDMATALLEDFFGKLAGALSEGGWPDIRDARKRLEAMLGRAVEVAEGPLLKNGCIMGILTVDMAETNNKVRRDLGNKFNAVVELVSPVIEAALSDAGAKPKTARDDSIALGKHFIAVIEGGILLGKATRNREEVANSVRCFRRMVVAMLGS
ncbi:MAG: TetR/AcrR family transcriptional regulator [Planctomycetota bacterium]